MKTTFTLEDIHNFLLQKGYPEWNYEVYDRYLGNKRKAKNEDFCDRFGFFEHTHICIVDKHGHEYCLEVNISDFEFKTYRDEPNVMGSGLTTYVHKDLTKEWIGFLFYTHEEEYAKSLLRHALKNKQRIKQEAEDKIEKFRWKTQQEAKGPYTYYRDLELKAKSILTVGEIMEIEQPNNPSCNENCLGVRYYDSTTMTIRNTNGKDEEEVLDKSDDNPLSK